MSDNSVVKSVGRVFEILECFKETERPMSATAIGSLLNYPQSSALALLRSLVQLSYLDYDHETRNYFPTARLLLLTNWLNNDLYFGSETLEIMNDLNRISDETIVMCSYRDIDLQVIHILSGNLPISFDIELGSTLPLFHSAAGHAFLANQSDNVIEKLVRRKNTRLKDGERAESVRDIMLKVDSVRAVGVSVGYSLVLQGVGAIAIGLRSEVTGMNQIISVGGPANRIREKEKLIVEVMRNLFLDNRASEGRSANG